MRKGKAEITEETIAVYRAIKTTMKVMKTTYCQSWWLTCVGNYMPMMLSTPEVNRRAKYLIKFGYITIDKKQTSTSMGICYLLTDKPMGI